MPIKAPVSGVAMGLIKIRRALCHPDRHPGAEDHLGDMDFELLAREGITALQMDIKITGITPRIMAEA